MHIHISQVWACKTMCDFRRQHQKMYCLSFQEELQTAVELFWAAAKLRPLLGDRDGHIWNDMNKTHALHA